MKADKTKVLNLLKTARGQMDGLIKMVEEDRYCVDISHQLMATSAVLKSCNREVLDAHLNSCVKEALVSGNSEEKVKEIMQIVEKLTK